MSVTLLAAMSAALLGPGRPLDDATARVRVDSARNEVAVSVGPFDIAALPPGVHHEEMEKMTGHDTPVFRFVWPVDGWFRGFRFELRDKNGTLVDKRVLHHMIMVNFDRRQLLYSAVERILGAGQETESASVPKSIGVPMSPDMRLGVYFAWSNETGKDLEGVTFTVYMSYSPSNLNPQPDNALPIYMDVNLTVGGTNTFDVPPGRHEKSYEFTMPTSGRLLGVGGHLHDLGESVRLEDAETGKVLTRIKAKTDKNGKLLKLERKLFGVSGAGLKLKEGHRYRVVGVYNNITGAVVTGNMAHMVGLFVPDDISKWPVIDLADETLQNDLAALDELGAHHHEGEDHTHP